MLGSVGNVRWSETLLIHLAVYPSVNHRQPRISMNSSSPSPSIVSLNHLNPSFGYLRIFKAILAPQTPHILMIFVESPIRRCGRRRSSGLRWRSNASGAGATADAADGNGSEIQLGVQLGLHMVDKI